MTFSCIDSTAAETLRWPDGIHCPFCASEQAWRNGGQWRCGSCKKAFTVRTGTAMEGSHLPPGTWLEAAQRPSETPSVLARNLGISFRAARRMKQAIAKAAFTDDPLFGSRGLPFSVQHIRGGSIFRGDCLDVMRAMPSESVGVVVTSPPYNLRTTSSGGARASGIWPLPQILMEGYDGHDDAMPHTEYVEWQRECIRQMLRVLKPNGAIFYNHKHRSQKGSNQDRSDILAPFRTSIRQICYWHRGGGHNFNTSYYLPNVEHIYILAKADFRLLAGANASGQIWRITPDYNNPHPAPFPVALPLKCLRDTGLAPVLDPFLGSGTTAAAAEMLGLPWLGIELAEAYCSMAAERLKADC